MLRQTRFFLLVTLVVLVGCDSGQKGEEKASNDPVAAEAGGFLDLPDGLDPKMVQAYQSLQENPDGKGLLTLTSISQVVATGLAEQRDGRADDFFLQTDRLIHEAIDAGMEVPDNALAGVAYNAASVYLIKNDAVKAIERLQEAVECGFPVEDLSRDTRMAALVGRDSVKSKLEGWVATAKAKVRTHAEKDLANGESFAFDFKLTDISGNEVSLKQHKGEVLIVDVWGTWCPPCRAEIPSFIKLQERYGPKGLQIIGLNYERGPDPTQYEKLVQDFVEANGVNYPCALGSEAIQSQIPDFGGFPTTLFIDRTGKVRMKAVGLHEFAYLEAIVETLLSE